MVFITYLIYDLRQEQWSVHVADTADCCGVFTKRELAV